MSTTAAPTLQTNTCLVCNKANADQLFVQRGYPVFRCATCGFEYVAPTPSAAELTDYYDNRYAVPHELYASASKIHEERIADLERWCSPPGSLLEVGASYGHSLALARERGWDVTGVELSPTASGYAREHFGLNVFNCDLTNCPLTESSFDAVIMWHVLEHAQNPKEQLFQLATLLKLGGVLGLRVPNITSFGARVAGQWWPWMCPPAHLWFFSSTTLPHLLRNCGFEVLEAKTQRGVGNNIYQYALMGAGNRINNLRTHFQRRPAVRDNKSASSAPLSDSSNLLPKQPRQQPEPSGLLKAWLHLLTRAQPFTNALARGTRPLIEPLERRGWGDELLVYARRVKR